jgi:hypothetical protein
LTLVDGVDADDNASFEIIGNALKVKASSILKQKSIKSCKSSSSLWDVLGEAFEIAVIDDKLPTVFFFVKIDN